MKKETIEKNYNLQFAKSSSKHQFRFNQNENSKLQSPRTRI